MADIDKITASNGTTYNIKDSTARDSISSNIDTSKTLSNINEATAVITFVAPGATNYPSGVGGNSGLLITYVAANPKYAAQLFMGFGYDKLAIRRKNNSETWSSWAYFTAS